MIPRPLALVAVLAVLVPGTRAAQGSRLLWRGEEVAPEEARRRLGDSLADLAETWRPFCEAHGYDRVLEEEGVALLVAPAGREPKAELRGIRRTREAFEELLPLPPRPTELSAPEKATPDESAWRREFAHAQSRLDRQALLLLALDDRKDYGEALRELARQQPLLASWTASVERYNGFVAASIHTAAWIRTEEGNQDLAPQNELVNGFARLLIQRRFGTVPHWARMGLAWQIELELLGVLYTHPSNPRQLVTVEGGGWVQELRRLHKRRKAFDLGEIVDWSPAAWDRDAAVRAFGLARFLVERRPADVPRLLDHLSALFWEKGRRRAPGGGWWWDATYQPGEADQRAVLERELGPEVLAEVAEYLKKKSGWEAPAMVALVRPHAGAR